MAETARNQAHRRALIHAKRALGGIDAALERRIERASGTLSGLRGKIVTCGVGKSGFIARKVAATLTSLGIQASFLHPTDALHGDLGVVGQADAVLAFSHSGNTKELMAPLTHIHRAGIPIFSVCGDARSRLSAMSAVCLAYRISGEGSPHDLAPMASTTVSLVIGDMLAAQIASARGFTKERFAQLHPSGTLGLQLATVADVMRSGNALPVVERSAPFKHALEVITEHRLGIAAVVDAEGRMSGAISDGDVRRFVLSGRFSTVATARMAMSPRPKTVGTDTSLLDALRFMERHKITSLFVVDAARRLRGVVHMHQIIERQLA